VSDFDTSAVFRGLPLAVLAPVSCGRTGHVAGLGGGNAMALPLIPSPSDVAAADDGRE